MRTTRLLIAELGALSSAMVAAAIGVLIVASAQVAFHGWLESFPGGPHDMFGRDRPPAARPVQLTNRAVTRSPTDTVAPVPAGVVVSQAPSGPAATLGGSDASPGGADQASGGGSVGAFTGASGHAHGSSQTPLGGPSAPGGTQQLTDPGGTQQVADPGGGRAPGRPGGEPAEPSPGGPASMREGPQGPPAGPERAQVRDSEPAGAAAESQSQTLSSPRPGEG